ncbi:ABC transporter permease [Nonomuraea sp. NPDC050556]|uniref:ABC transporter permease n=1 Tax=Nonomuraea sp. NPDC050556 TaxID=3364369 RepID=UPI003790D398
MKSRALVIARHEARLLRTNPWIVVILIIIPGLLLAFFANGIVGGPARAIPGLAALFGFFGLSAIGLAFYRDHGWMTWDRLRASGTRPFAVIIGKLTPLAVMFLLQYIVLFPLGWLAFGMEIRGSLLGLALVTIALVAVELGIGLLLAVVCTSIAQLNSLVSVGTMLLVGIAGALSPINTFPGWIQAIAPVSPVYWSFKGFHSILADGAGLGDVIVPIAVLTGMATVCFVLSGIFYKHEQRKTFFA